MKVLAVDCGGSRLRVAVVDAQRAVTLVTDVATPAAAAEIPGAIVAAAAPVAADIESCGIGVAGLVHHPSGVLRWMPHRPGVDVPVGEEVAAALGVPVAVDNDANLAGLAEARLGAAAGAATAIVLRLGTGIGGALLAGGNLIRGAAHAGEVGHLRVAASGPVCRCGARGCWEAFVSGTAFDRLALEILGAGRRGPDLTRAAAQGEAAAVTAVDEASRMLGMGIVSLIAAFDPEVVVVGGPAAAGELLLAGARVTLASEIVGGRHRPLTRIAPARLGEEAGLLGAALLAGESG